MRALLAVFERRYWGPRTKRRNASHHQPYPTTHAAVTTRKAQP